MAVAVELDSSNSGVLEQYLALNEGVRDVSFLLSADCLMESFVGFPLSRPLRNLGKISASSSIGTYSRFGLTLLFISSFFGALCEAP